MKILITGASGFVGVNFVKNIHTFEIMEVDLLTCAVEEIDFTGIDTVLHLAALVHQMKGAPEEQYFKVNRDLAFQVAKRAKNYGVKQFVFMSTVKVYGESTTGKPAWNENSECSPLDAYGKSKFEAEKKLFGLYDENFKVVVVRSPLVYGAGVKANMYNLVKLVDRFFVLPLGNILNARSMVYIGNLVALLNCIIEKRVSGVFIAGDQTSLSTTDLTRLIAKSFNKKLILFKIPEFLISLISLIKPSIIDRLFGSLELDNSNTNKMLGFTPPYTIEMGVSEMVSWYKNVKNG